MEIWRKVTIKIFIILGLWAFLQAKAEEELVCDITGACDYQYPGTRIADPFDCHKYYICITNADGDVILSDGAMLCPTGYYFDEGQGDCLTENYKCRSKCDNLFCTRSCDDVDEGTLIAYPNDCSKFIVCLDENSDPVVGQCASETPYFNGTSCTTDAYSCCDICTPYCEFAFTEVEDPYDCNSFYLCQTDDYLPESEHFTCESGQYFDRSEAECVDSNGTVCYPTCNLYTTPTTTWLYYTTQRHRISTNPPFTSSGDPVTSEVSDLPSDSVSTETKTPATSEVTAMPTNPGVF